MMLGMTTTQREGDAAPGAPKFVGFRVPHSLAEDIEAHRSKLGVSQQGWHETATELALLYPHLLEDLLKKRAAEAARKKLEADAARRKRAAAAVRKKRREAAAARSAQLTFDCTEKERISA